MIIVFDYGMGNCASIVNMIKRAGGSAKVSAEVSDVEKASAIIIPGVGSFDNGISKLSNNQAYEALVRAALHRNIPILGICLGMQLLFDDSEEGTLPGLGWLKGRVRRFQFDKTSRLKALKVPHMGWNLVFSEQSQSLLDCADELRFYFVHSYYVECDCAEDILARTSYGIDFVCAVRRRNIFGVQFHPEKSHNFGVVFFKNFLRLIDNA